MVLKKKALAMALALVAGCAAMGSAHAQNAYVGAAFAQYNIEGTNSFTPTAASFKLGYAFNSYFALEGRVSTSTSSDGVKIDSHSAIYAKGMLPLNDKVSAYGLLGTNNLAVKSTYSSASQSGSSYGLGIDFAATKDVSLSLEWARHFSNVTSVGLGIAYKF